MDGFMAEILFLVPYSQAIFRQRENGVIQREYSLNIICI